MNDASRGETARLAARVAALKRCFALSGLVTASLDLPEVLERIMTTSAKALGAETVSLLLVDDTAGPGRGELIFTVAHGPASRHLQSGFRLRPGEGLAGWVAANAAPVLLKDVYDDPRFNREVDRLTGYRTRSMVCVPLVYRDRVVGVAQGINKKDGGTFSTDDLELFSLLGAQAAVAIVNATLHREALEKQRLEFDLELAASVQQGFWPTGAPPLPGYDVAGASVPCDATGGDYYDYLMRPATAGGPTACVLAVGDVTGHGIQAALLMASVRAFLRARLLFPGGPAAVLDDVNRLLAQDLGLSGRFMTLFLLELDPASGRVRFVRAGHDPALLYDPAADAFTELTGRGIPLGVTAEWRFEENVVERLTPGGMLVCGTDGIWESRDVSDAMYGKTRLRRVLREAASGDAQSVTQAVLADLALFRQGAPQRDDVTLVVVKAEPNGNPKEVA